MLKINMIPFGVSRPERAKNKIIAIIKNQRNNDAI